MTAASPHERAFGDELPPHCQVLKIHIGTLDQLFNSMDPAPFRERDLDPNAEEFIVGWARELRADGPLALLVHLDKQPGTAEEAAMLKDAVRKFFEQRAIVTRQRLHQLLRVGRISLIIGLLFLALSIATGNLAVQLMGEGHFNSVVRESLLIGGWVAMWRPLEVFLYDWWPILSEARSFDRLRGMAVRIAQPTG